MPENTVSRLLRCKRIILSDGSATINRHQAIDMGQRANLEARWVGLLGSAAAAVGEKADEGEGGQAEGGGFWVGNSRNDPNRVHARE